MRINDRKQMSPLAQAVMDVIEQLGMKGYLETEHAVQADFDSLLQVRVGDGHIPSKQKVQQIALAMSRNTAMPPIVVTSDGVTVDGNGRQGGARKNNRTTIEAIVLNRPYHNADPATRSRLRLLGSILNRHTGQDLDRDDIRATIETAMDQGDFSREKLASLLKISTATVTNTVDAVTARNRAEGLGVVVNSNVTQGQLQNLGKASSKLNDTPYVELVRLCVDFALKATVFNPLLKEVLSKTNDAEKLEVINAQRRFEEIQLGHLQMTGKPLPTPWLDIKQSVLDIVANEIPLLRTGSFQNTTVSDEELKKIKKAAQVLQDIIKNLTPDEQHAMAQSA